MNTNDCFCKKKKCERHGRCEECRAYHDALEKKRPVACERKQEKTVYTELLRISAFIIAIQGLFIAVKSAVFRYTEETIFSRSMVTMVSMIVILALMILFFKLKHYTVSVFPKKFGLVYIITTAIAVVFFIITLFFIRTFTIQNALMLFYGSMVTPVMEELLFRGAIWNRLNKYFDKEWKSFLMVTLLFAIWHIGYAVGLFLWSGESLLKVMTMKVLIGAAYGVITGVLRYKTKNCYIGILIHGILNTFG